MHAIYNVLHYQRPYQAVAGSELGEAQVRRLLRHHERRIKHLLHFLRQQPTPDLEYLLNRVEREG